MSRSLSDAVRAGNTAEVEIRLNMGEDLDQADPPLYRSPLHWAVACDQLHIAELLVQRGARVEVGDRGGGTALALAKSEKKPQFVELLARAGAQAISSPCTLPILEVKTDPLFRDPPPWQDSPGGLLGPACGSQRQEQKLAPRMFKKEQSVVGPRPWTPQAPVPATLTRPLALNTYQSSCFLEVSRPKSQASHVSSIQSQGGPGMDMEEENRPMSQASQVSSVQFPGGLLNFSDNDGQVEADEPSVRDAERPKDEGSSVRSYMTNLLKGKQSEEAGGRGERGNYLKTGEAGVQARVQACLSTLMRPKAKEAGSEARPVSHSLSQNRHLSLAESMKTKGTSAKTYMSNLLQPKGEDGVQATKQEEEEEDTDKTTESKIPKPNVSEPASLTAKGSSFKEQVANLLQSKSPNVKGETKNDTNATLANVSKTVKSKASDGKMFVSTLMHTKSEEKDKKKDAFKTFGKVSSTFFKSKGSSVRSYMSNMTKNAQSKQNTNDTNSSETKMSATWKAKAASAKNIVSDRFKQKASTAEAGADGLKTNITSESAPIIGQSPRMFASVNKDPVSQPAAKADTKDKTFSMKTHIPNTQNIVNRVDCELFEEGSEAEANLRRGVRDYVKRYEEKHIAAGGAPLHHFSLGDYNPVFQCHARPFKEFTDSALSGSGGRDSPRLAGPVPRDTQASVAVKWNDEDMGGHGEEKEMARKRRWDIKADFKQFTVGMEQMKKGGSEKASRSWRVLRGRVKRLPGVRALHRTEVGEGEGEGDSKVFLKNNQGKAMKFYTFRKSSSR